MRTLAKFFGYAGGVVVVIVAGQYAYMTSDTPVSGAIWAFLYGFIAIGGLFGPALATRVWAYNKAASVFIWAVALASLTIAISNEVGAMAPWKRADSPAQPRCRYGKRYQGEPGNRHRRAQGAEIHASR